MAVDSVALLQIRFSALLLTLALLLMAGCGAPATEQPAASENAAPVAVDEATATPLPTDTPAPTDTHEPAPVAEEPTATSAPVAEPAPTDTPEPEPDWTQTVFIDGDLYIRGNPDAPIRLIDYSDFF